jgi:hypothetical protein
MYTYVCPACGTVNESVDPTARFECVECGADMILEEEDDDEEEEGGGLSDA